MSSVKVAVRVRPFNQREISMNSECIIKMSGTMTKIMDPESRKDKTFHFDYSYWSHDGFDTDGNGFMTAKSGSNYTDQRRVFNDLGVDVLNNAWQGYHTCLFAYGQTGSGKSYSIVGYGANKGIIPMACEDIFQRIEEKRKGGDGSITYNVEVSMLEIYNECVQDLFVKPAQRIKGGLNVRERAGGQVYVENLSSVPVNSYTQISRQIDVGTNNRTVGATNMNATSSRAHTIVTIQFKQTFYDKDTGQPLNRKASNINLVDLAGSERAGSTGASGDRLKEGANINKSLSVLGKVIQTLAEKASGKGKTVIVPYRESKLTRILQTNLGGNSKTAMIAALSPASVNYEETLSTLRYANQVKNIKNEAKVNESPQDKLIRELREENQKLKEMIEKGTLPSMQQQAPQEQEWEGKTHIMNLNQDPYLSGNIRHIVKGGSQQVGNKGSPDIEIRGLGIAREHCKFEGGNGEFILVPNEEHDKYQVLVNGSVISEPTRLEHNDRIRFGMHNYFLFVMSGQESDSSIDWEHANDEATQKNVDQFANQNPEENEELKEKLGEIQSLKQEKEKAQKEMQDKIKKMEAEQQAREEELRKKFENQASEAESQQKKELEDKLKKDLQDLERQKKKMEEELAQNVESKRKKALEMELQLREKQEFQRQLRDIIIKINQVNEISSSMGKNQYLYEPMLNIVLEQGLRKSHVCCKAYPDRNDPNYYNQISYTDFLDIYYNIKARWEDFQFDLENQNDGVLEIDPDDEEKDKELFGMLITNHWKLIGHSNIYLQGIANLVETENDMTPIIDNSGKANGRLKYSVYPKMPKEADQDEMLQYDNVEEMKGKIIRIHLKIDEARGLPEKYSYNTFCKYKWIDEKDLEFETEKQPFSQNPQFNYVADHDVFVSKFVIDKLWTACLTVDVYGQMNIEQKKKKQESIMPSEDHQSLIGDRDLPAPSTHHKDTNVTDEKYKKLKKENDDLKKQLDKLKNVEVSRKSSCCVVF